MPLTEDLPEEDQNYWISAVKTSGDWKQEIYHGMITYMYVLKLDWFICNTIPVQYNTSLLIPYGKMVAYISITDYDARSKG